MHLLIIVGLLLVTACQSASPARGTPATTVTTQLMFQEGRAHDAMSLYASVFAGFRVLRTETYGPGGEGPAGTFKLADVELYGHRLMIYDSPIKHAFTFTPSVSLLVDFATAEELDAAFAKLADGGELLMPVDDYGFSRRFGWCTDRFGMSWQLNLPAEPSVPTEPAR